MPELPEVQTIVEDLNKKIIGRRIVDVWFDAPKLIKKPKPEDFRVKIKDLRINGVKRRGKNIRIYLNQKSNISEIQRTNYEIGKNQNYNSKIPNFLLLIHQKMTGHLLYGKWKIAGRKVVPLIKGPLEEKVNNYIHLIFYLDNGWQLALSDLRKFAKILFGTREEIENLPELKNLGPEPLDENFTLEKFKKALRQAQGKRKIKQVLIDQEVIAGIGNIYSDEILWQAKIHPFTRMNKLKAYQLKNLYKALRQILQKAVKLRGTSISDYRDTEGNPGRYMEVRNVYRREGEPCPRCQIPIKRIKIGGRSAHYCPNCQKL